MHNFRSQSSFAKTIVATLVKQEYVQQKFDSQMCSVESFKNLLQTKKDEHIKIPAKHVLVVEAWRFILIRLDPMKQHKAALCMQTQGMMSGHQHPTLMPLPLLLLCMENPNYPNFPWLLSILPCLFYQGLFEPAWDHKITFCKHTYHSWCVITHFSSSIKFLLEGCGEKMHPNCGCFMELRSHLLLKMEY